MVPARPPRAGRLPVRLLHRLSVLIAVAFTVTTVAALALPASTLAWAPNAFSPADEQSLFALTNQARASAGLRSLTWDPALASIARWRSQDMIDRAYFSHQIPPSGSSVFDEMSDRSYCFKLAGENIGWNTYPDDVATAQIQQAFMDSPGHRSNILGSAWDVAGIGAYSGSDGKKMWTVLFADKCGSTPTPTPDPTPQPTPKPTVAPTPTPQPTPKPTVAPTPTPTPTPQPTPKPTVAPTPTPRPAPTAKPTATPRPTPTPTPQPEPTATSAAEPTPSATPTPAATPTPEPTATVTPALAEQPTPSPTEQPTPTPTPDAAAGPSFGQSLRVVDQPAPQGLLETIFGGIAGFFFGG